MALMERLFGSKSQRTPLTPSEVWDTATGKKAIEARYNPDIAWEKLQVKSPVEVLESLTDPSTPCPDNHTRFVCVSDTHGRTDRIKFDVPWGHVLLHAGDFTDIGQPSQVEAFSEFLGGLPHEHKVVIAGNHDLTFDSETFPKFQAEPRFTMHAPQLKAVTSEGVKALLTNCTYLEDSETTVRGFRIYGSPWQPEFCSWGFNLPRGDPCLEKWQKIPSNVDILMTHGPPIGHGDLCTGGNRAGCVDLLREVQYRIRPKYHVFGHIHEAYGVTTDSVTTFVNASTCSLQYRPVQPPIVFDLPNPKLSADSAAEE